MLYPSGRTERRRIRLIILTESLPLHVSQAGDDVCDKRGLRDFARGDAAPSQQPRCRRWKRRQKRSVLERSRVGPRQALRAPEATERQSAAARQAAERYNCGTLSRIKRTISLVLGERPASFLEKICRPLSRTRKEPGAPARRCTEPPSSRSIASLRLTASALMSAQKKQRLISIVMPKNLL